MRVGALFAGVGGSPEASDSTGGRRSAQVGGQRPSGSKRAITLGTRVHALLPTPEAKLARSGHDPTRKDRGKSGGPDLTTTVGSLLLPTPMAQQSGNSPADHLKWKPGRVQITDLAILVENNLLETGGRPPAEKLLPTPDAYEATRGGSQPPENRDRTNGPYLASVVEWSLMPTPRATRGGSTTEISYALGGERDDEDRPQGEVLFPTPRASDPDKGSPAQRGSRDGDVMLTGAVMKLLPTTTARDELGSRNSTAWRSKQGGHSGETLTDFVWKQVGHVDPRLRGETTDPRSDDGSPSSDE